MFVSVLESHLKVVPAHLGGCIHNSAFNNLVQAEGCLERGNGKRMIEILVLIEPLGGKSVLIGRLESLVNGSQILQAALG